ncbi:uncharacterized mitochondrial protein-like protein [Tanacetum coccineum]
MACLIGLVVLSPRSNIRPSVPVIRMLGNQGGVVVGSGQKDHNTDVLFLRLIQDILEEISQDCIVMPIWKDTSYFNSPTKDVDNGEPKTVDDAQKQVKDSSNNKNAKQDKFEDDSNDIIFGSTNKELCIGFEKLMKDKFQMSSMGELTFFLGLQVQQKEDGIFISRDKYVAEILKKFNYSDVKSASTPVDLEKPLVKDGDADDVDVHLYRSMIGSLMYLTASRPDIMFAVCACARFQVTPKTSHLLAVKRIFRYLKGKPTLGLWYSRDSPFELVAYTDSDYAGATQDRKSTTGGCQFLGNRLISWQCKKQTVVATSTTEAEYVAAASCCGQVKHVEYLMLNASPFEVMFEKEDNGLGSQLIKTRLGISKEVGTPRYLSLVVPLTKVGDEAVYKELGDRMERAATTASS